MCKLTKSLIFPFDFLGQVSRFGVWQMVAKLHSFAVGVLIYSFFDPARHVL